MKSGKIKGIVSGAGRLLAKTRQNHYKLPGPTLSALTSCTIPGENVMKHRRTAILLSFLAVAAAGLWFVLTYLEGAPPEVRLIQDVHYLGRTRTLDIACADGKSGLRSIQVHLVQDNCPVLVHAVQYPSRGVRNAALSFPVEPLRLHLHDGAATLQVTAVDFSLRKNEIRMAKPVQIRTSPPQIFPLNPTNILNPGGTGVTVWRTSDAVVETGIAVGDHVARGYEIVLAGKPSVVCYFAVPMDAKTRGAAIRIIARDGADNTASASLPVLLRDKRFRSDAMNLSAAFLQRKMPEFQAAYPQALQGKSLREVFLWVNETLRAENNRTIMEICRQSEGAPLWEGAFLRMKNASPMALFGDQRTYMLDGKSVGESIHEGVDLASTENAPIEAANHGKVVFAGNLGIYGNTIILDHGLGLFSLYGHLASLGVAKDQAVRGGDLLGRSGMSGLAGGDHLHFSMIAGGRFVNPIEWWDAHWIADNVEKKLRDAS